MRVCHSPPTIDKGDPHACSGGRTGCPLFDACLFAGMRRVYAHSVPFSVLLPSFGLFWFFVEQHKACCRS